MARPSKSIDVQSGGISSETAQERRDIENKLKGESGEVVPTFELSERQTEIFNRIKSMFDKARGFGPRPDSRTRLTGYSQGPSGAPRSSTA